MALPLLVLPLLALGLWWSWRGGWLRAGSWFALALLGQACALGLYEAGPVVSYHHLRPPGEPGARWLLLAPLVLQLVLAAAACARSSSELLAWLRRNFRARQLALALAVWLCASAKLSRPAQASALEFALSALIQLLALATVWLGAASLPPAALAGFRERWERVFGGSGASTRSNDRFGWLAAGWVALVCALLAWFVYQRHPHLPDEVVYLMHANYLAQGRLWLDSPPVPEAFDVDLMLLWGERWFCPVPPGWPFVLAAGAFLGAPWLVNPLLSAAAVLLAYAFLREVAERRSARIAVALLCVSPWFLFLGMSFMSHTWTLVCALLAAWGVARSKRTGRTAWAALGGAAIGAASLVRPLEGLLLAGLIGAWSLAGTRLRLAALSALVASTAAVAALVLPYDRALTGVAWPPPINVYVDTVYGPGRNDLGFGANRGLGWGGLDPWPGHTPFQALVNAQFNLFSLESELFGWASGSLWLVLLAAVWVRRRALETWMWAAILAIALANSLYWFSGGPDFGARYWFLAVLPLVALSASGLAALGDRLGAGAPRAAVVTAVLACSALVTFLPWRAADKYFHYRGMEPGVRELSAGFGRSLVLVRGERHPDFASAAALNPTAWDAAAPIYAWDRDPQTRQRVLEHYSDRPVWILEGPSRTGAGFRILAGPVPAAELLAREREGKL